MVLAGLRVGFTPKAAICIAAVVFLWVNALVTAQASDERTARPPVRIVSINACTDQLLYALADKSQIAALTHYSVKDDYSIFAREIGASGLMRIQGGAEEVLKLKPDLVLAGTFTRRATRQILNRYDMHVELFSPSRTIAESKQAIRRVAQLVGHEERGEGLIARIDGALAEMRTHRGPSPVMLQLQRGGYVSGPDTLIGDLLSRLGVRNASPALGIDRIGNTSLEKALKLRADGLVLFDPSLQATDQGAAMLLHPALREIYPPGRRIVVPGHLVVCGGPALPLAIAELQRQLRKFQSQWRPG